ncbi:MAG: hypothetical protein H6510_10795 [Acidobacteria bacterium]|nr:FAD-binding protein [Acidobacteriota bacterium]MCB9398297.1 hypothetical protein [Acidobacteriota bacterium]
MSQVKIACLLAPMIDTEGPMNVNGTALDGAKRIMGKFGEIGLETAITFGSDHPNAIHTDILSIGSEKQVTALQQTAIAMFQPGTHPGSLDVYALNNEQIESADAFAVAGMLLGMIEKLPHRPDMIFVGRESWDYGHGLVGPFLAEKLGMPYFSGVHELKFHDDFKKVTATFLAGSDKVVYDIALPAIFGTTDSLNGKDSARFTSLKGVMMAKKFQRKTIELADLGSDPNNRTAITQIEPVKSDRKKRRIEDGEGQQKVDQAINFLVREDKALVAGDGGADGSNASGGGIQFASADPSALGLANDVVLIGDHDGKQIRLSTFQALRAAKQVGASMGKKTSLVIFAKDAKAVAQNAAQCGADQLVVVSGDLFERSSLTAYRHGLDKLMAGSKPAVLLTVATPFGRDLAALLAAHFDGALLQEVISLNATDGKLSGKRIISNARFVAEQKITHDGTQVASIRATAFDPADAAPLGAAAEVSLSDSIAMAAVVKEFVQGVETKGIPLNEAKIVVSGGRGMKGPENFAFLDKLASLLGGAVGASRAVTDLGWVPHNLQIGQTGMTVAPDIYFAIGISGAIQHLTGMLDSKYIVAINPDPEAPIHQYADLSIIDKWQNVMEPLTEAIAKAMGK